MRDREQEVMWERQGGAKTTESLVGHGKKCAGGHWRVLSRGVTWSDLHSKRFILAVVYARLWVAKRGNSQVKRLLQ